MSLTQLQAYYQPWLKKRSLRRELLVLRKNTQKTLVSYVRKTKSKALRTARSQYYIATAYNDARAAAARNEDIVITMTILAIVLSYGTAAVSIDLLVTAFSAVFAFSEVTNIDSSIFIIMTFGSLGIIAGWLAALVLNMQSIALMDGANRKQLSTIRSTVRKSLRLTSRVAISWIILSLILFGIPLAGAFVASLYLSQTSITMLEMLKYMPYAVTAGIAWATVMLMEYGLVPYIMLFEPHLTIRQTLRRSNELIRNKGRIFILFANISLGVLLACAYGIALKVEALLGVHRGLHFFGYALALLLLFNAVMTMFYRKRKLARK